MENRFKIVLSNTNFYKEIELTPNMSSVKVGTSVDCEVRLYKDWFFEPISLHFLNDNGSWMLTCSDNLYVALGDVRKLVTKTLQHGDAFVIKYQQYEIEAFSIEFMLDFGSEDIRYERAIHLGNQNNVSIGYKPSSNIVIGGEYIHNDEVVLLNKDNRYALITKETTYGVYHNGKKAKDKEVIVNGDFFSISDYFFYLKDNILWTEIRPMTLNELKYEDHPEPENYPKFNRNTRIKTVLSEEEIEILDPPTTPEKPKNNLIMRLMPSLGMLIAAGLMMYLSSKNGGSGGMMAFSFITGGMAVITAIMGVIEGNKDYKKGVKERIEKYTTYIENKEKEIESIRADEGERLEKIYISQKDAVNSLSSFSSELFDRVPEDEDFLSVRLGNGLVQAKREIKYKKQERLEVGDELQKKPEELAKKYRMIENAPVVCELKEVNALGIVGKEEYRFEIFKNIVIDLAARHYHSDLNMVFVVSPQNHEHISWVRFLPHAYSDRLNSRTIVTDDESKTIIFEYLFKVLSAREEQKKYDEHIVVFLYDDAGFRSHPISRFVENAKDLGVSFVFFAATTSELPIGCSYIVDIKNNTEARLVDTADTSKSNDFGYPHIDDSTAEQIVSLLAPVYTEEISLESSLTKNYSMFQMLNILAVDDLNLETRWALSHAEKSMAAPIGISKTGIVTLDLHDKAHGPHGLVAGTTGSGKSEILQTYILAMSTLFHPYEVGFVIIDFKGGGMVNQFANLPHLMGAITNIDGKEINRSLKSIKAELQKRQRYFAEADVNHIDKYIKKYKNGEVKEPLPHLIIIVDEFAELKAEQPEFMKELISAARIGRSLGVHLILATQKPAGQVNEQIWSNSRFKLCLKVQSPEDSNEVLKSPLAAEIKEPGRAYLQVGNNEIFELFQSAYSGGSEKSDDAQTREFTLSSISETGKRRVVYQQKKQKKGEGNSTQLDAIVRYVSDYFSGKGLRKLPNICLPPLENHLTVPKRNMYCEGLCDIGIYDDPDKQYQGSALITVDSENTVIIGSSQTGKTNLLQLIIRAIASTESSNHANFYIADFGSMILNNFRSLAHVGGVVTANEDEKFKNLIKLLLQEIESRKEIFVEFGVSSFAAYKEAGHNDLSHIYFIMDNYPVFKELYSDKYEDDFLFLTREGLSCGISVIITTPSLNGFGYRYLSNFANRIAFQCNDSGEYSSLFDRCHIYPEPVPGRALLSLNKELYEVQTYYSFDGEKEIDRANAIAKFVMETNSVNTGKRAKSIPEVPELFDLDYINDNYRIDVQNELSVALNYQLVEPVALNLYTTTQIAIVGNKMDNIISFEKAILTDIKKYYFDRQTDVYLVDSITRGLIDYSEEAFVKTYSIDYSKVDHILESISVILEKRYNMVIENGIDCLKNQPLLMVIINNIEAIKFISESRELMNLYNLINSKYKSMKVMLIFGGIPDETIGYSSPDLLKKIKENKNAFIFSNITEHKIYDISSKFSRSNKKTIDSTQGFYIKENDVYKIRFAKEV